MFALLCSSCTHVVWYGRSDDRRHVASVIEQGTTQHVRFDMVDGPNVVGVGVDALVIDGAHLAYPAQSSDGWAVMRDGLEGPHFDSVGEVLFQHQHLAYTAEKAGKWLVVFDGTPGELFDTILPGSLTLGSTGRLAYAAQQEGRVFAIIDGLRSAPMDGVGQLRFSSDGLRAGFVGRKQGTSSVFVDGVERGPFETITDLQLGPPDVFVAKKDGSWRVDVDGQPGEPFDRIAGLFGAAYAGRRGKEEWVVDGSHQLGPFTSLKSKLARDASGRLVFTAQRGEAWTVVIGDTESTPWTEVEVPAINGDHVGFIGVRDGQSVVVLDGKEVSTWDWAGSLVLSGSRSAHLARKGGRTVVIVDGAERNFEFVVAGTLAFSKDGKRFGCVTGEVKTRRLFITRDDGKRTVVDMEEVVASLSRGATESLLTSPDVTLLRRWVEAELEH